MNKQLTMDLIFRRAMRQAEMFQEDLQRALNMEEQQNEETQRESIRDLVEKFGSDPA